MRRSLVLPLRRAIDPGILTQVTSLHVAIDHYAHGKLTSPNVQLTRSRAIQTPRR